MSSIAKTSISISKKDLTKSRIPPVASRNVVFYHQATAGQITIDLNNLTMPSEMPSQVQATNDEISGARLSLNKKNLSVISSANGPLIQGLDYVVADSYTIRLIGIYAGVGSELDEIFVGNINCAPISDLVVATSQDVVKTTTAAIGQTTVNLGNEYKVGANALENVGAVRIWINGVLALRDQDYSEVDSGNGFGSTIELLSTPTLTAWSIVADFGVRAVTDQDALGTIESINGSILKLATDLADVAGTDVTDYLTANPSEVERRTFGDMVLVHEQILDAPIPWEEDWESFDPFAGAMGAISQGFGAPTGINFRRRRSGPDLLVEGEFTAGTTTGVQGRIAFSDSLVASSIIVDTEVAGVLTWTDASNPSIFPLRNGGISYLMHANTAAGGGGLAPENASTRFSVGDRISICARIPIQGWTASRTIRDILGL
jgi:hypothetical protein